MCRLTLTTLLMGVVVIRRLGLAMINLSAKFELTVSVHYREGKDDT